MGTKTDLVSSFIAGVAGESGVVDGVCIKYAMHNKTFRLAYFDKQWFNALFQCVEYYSGTRYRGSDMQREADEPEFVASLPMRHPVRTMAREKPSLTAQEYHLAKRAFCVTSLRMGDQGDKCHLVCTYANGDRRIEILPGYIVMNLCAYLKASINLYGFVTTPPSGSA